MALPQQVIDNLSNEKQETPKSFSGLITFSIGIFILLVVIYLGIIFGYDPYLNSQLSQTNTQMNNLVKSIPGDQQASLLKFYSGLSNVQVLLKNHTAFSPFFTWLEKNTESNVYYTNLSISSQQKISLTVNAKSQSDMEQQIAIFEKSPDISNFSISSINSSQQSGNSVLWQQASVSFSMATSTFIFSNTNM
jgi:uncharacterized protein YpmB